MKMDVMEGTATQDEEVILATQELLAIVESLEMRELMVRKDWPAVMVDLAIQVDLDTVGDPERW